MRGRLAFGLTLLVAAVAWMLDVVGVFTFPGGWAVWWPSAIVLLGLFQLLLVPVSWEGPLFLLVVGGLLQAWRLDALGDSPWRVLGPAVLGLAAILIIAGAFSGRRRAERWARRQARRMHEHAAPRPGEDVAVFSEIERRHDEEFRGGEMTSVFGRLHADLRAARLPPEGAHVKATSVFGQLDLQVPEGWKVVVRGTPVFSRADNATRGAAEGPVLDVAWVGVFGNLNVSH